MSKYNEMMPKKSKIETIIDIVPSKKENKKYDALIMNNETKRMRTISFGDKNYQQFYDKIGHYKQLNHNDELRRQRYLTRHSKYPKMKDGRYTASALADFFLW